MEVLYAVIVDAMAFVRESDTQLEARGVAVASVEGVRGDEAVRRILEVLDADRAVVQVTCTRYRCDFQLWGLYVGCDD